MKKLKTLDDVYKAIPEINCQGKCQESCGPIPLFAVEVETLEQKGIPIPTTQPGTATCSALKDGKCSIYSNRPFLCRLFGNVPKMACPWGCKPKRFLSPMEERRLIVALVKLSKGEAVLDVQLNPIEIVPDWMQ